MHIHAVSVSFDCAHPFQYGGHQSAGQPDHADGMIDGGDPANVSVPATVTPCGSPGVTSWSGPTVEGGLAVGLFGFGTMSSGGRIALVNQPISRSSAPEPACGRHAAPTPTL